MRRDDIDFHAVRDDHLVIHVRLESWARWVRVRPHGWQVSPMFRMYQSKARQWHQPEVREAVNVPEALEMERVIAALPEKHREALRWSYVFPGGPAAVARRLGVSMEGLKDLVATGRSMVRNLVLQKT